MSWTILQEAKEASAAQVADIDQCITPVKNRQSQKLRVTSWAFCGELMIVVFNHGSADYTINAGDRAAQLILEKIDTPAVLEVKELQKTTRGVSGFGSTGT